MGSGIFTIKNVHVDDIPGEVSALAGTPGWLFFYAQNEYFEQMVLAVKPTAPLEVRFSHGDAGWDTLSFGNPGDLVEQASAGHPYALFSACRATRVWIMSCLDLALGQTHMQVLKAARG